MAMDRLGHTLSGFRMYLTNKSDCLEVLEAKVGNLNSSDKVLRLSPFGGFRGRSLCSHRTAAWRKTEG